MSGSSLVQEKQGLVSINSDYVVARVYRYSVFELCTLFHNNG